MNRMKLLIIGLVASALFGCASGSALVIGQTRPAIENYDAVRILTEMPLGAEEIAIVSASSADGWTQQQSLDYAVAELKKQAAKVGANAVVVTSRDTGSQVVGVPTYGGGKVVSSSEIQIVEGTAIFVGPAK